MDFNRLSEIYRLSPIFAEFGRFFQFSALFFHILPDYARFSQILTDYAIFTDLHIFSQILTYFAIFFGDFGRIWQILPNFGKLCHIFADFESLF